MDIVNKANIKATQKTVYQAFATEKGIQAWWCKNSQIGTAVGDAITLKFNYEGQTIEMNFEMADRTESMVEWVCVANANPAWIGTRIRFEAEGQGEETHLTLAHTGFQAQWADSPPYLQTVNGWKPFVASFQSWCETGVGQPG